jgi:hypothetical protein
LLLNTLKAELNRICKAQKPKLFCGAFKLCALFLKNLNISRTKRDKFLKHKAFGGMKQTLVFKFCNFTIVDVSRLRVKKSAGHAPIFASHTLASAP